MRIVIALAFILVLTGCTTPMQLPSSGTWEDGTVILGPVVVCKGGNFSSEPEGCNQWPLSVPTMPSPDIHYHELRLQASDQYKLPYSAVILKDVHVNYTTEINGVIRGWRATALAGRAAQTETTGK